MILDALLFAAPLFGHNLTPTTEMLPDGRYTVGTYAVGYALEDEWLIATSPWLAAYYNMPMVLTRVGTSVGGFVERVVADLSYFKSWPYGMNLYQQESAFLRVTGSHRVGVDNVFFFSSGAQYFKDDTRPYSLRLEPENPEPWNFSVSGMDQLTIFGDAGGVHLEAGILGLNYHIPWWHFGASLFWRFEAASCQIGMSRSGRSVEWTLDGGEFGEVYFTHPEFSLQAFF